MDLFSAIEAFNNASSPKIKLLPKRDGRVNASLPRTGHTILVVDSQFKQDVKVSERDLALLCQEARTAAAPANALLDAALGAMNDLAGPRATTHASGEAPAGKKSAKK
jgi:hypothetical protein